jgi:hypothetical protein
MNDDLVLQYVRWRAAEESGDDEEADAAFGAVFEASVSMPLPSREFAARTMTAIAGAAGADARRARRLRRALIWTGVPVGAAAVYFGAGPFLSVLSAALVGALNLLISAIVWFASGPEAHGSVWSLLTSMGRATAAFAADPRVTIAMLAFQAIAVGALVALHRMLGEREWLK